MDKNIIVSGAGIVGLATSMCLAKLGYKVKVYERRNILNTPALYSVNRSLSLDLSYRGQLVLAHLELIKKLMENSIVLNKRIYHTNTGPVIIDTDKEHKGFYSISHVKLWKLLLDSARQYENIKINFNSELIHLDIETSEITFRDAVSQKVFSEKSSIVIGCDGSGSRLRDIVAYYSGKPFREQNFTGFYKEVRIHDKKGFLQKDATHFWFKKEGIMLVVHPTLDNYCEGHLFLTEDKNNPHRYSILNTPDKINEFVESYFPELSDLLDREDMLNNPIGKIRMIDQVDVKYSGKTKILLIGDSAHSMVPFLGQGVNCGLEDCFILNRFLEDQKNDWESILINYAKERSANTDAVVEMSLQNAPEFIGEIKDQRGILNRIIDNYIKHKHTWYLPFVDLAYFTDVPYSSIKKVRQIQREMLNILSKDKKILEEIDKNILEKTVERYKNDFINIYKEFAREKLKEDYNPYIKYINIKESII